MTQKVEYTRSEKPNEPPTNIFQVLSPLKWVIRFVHLHMEQHLGQQQNMGLQNMIKSLSILEMAYHWYGYNEEMQCLFRC